MRDRTKSDATDLKEKPFFVDPSWHLKIGGILFVKYLQEIDFSYAILPVPNI